MHNRNLTSRFAQRAAVAWAPPRCPRCRSRKVCRNWRTPRAAPATASWRPSATTATTSSCSWPCWWWRRCSSASATTPTDLRGDPHRPQDVGPVRPHGRHRRRAARDRHLAAHRSHRHPVSEAGMSEQQHVRADGTVTFLPHRLNRHPLWCAASPLTNSGFAAACPAPPACWSARRCPGCSARSRWRRRSSSWAWRSASSSAAASCAASSVGVPTPGCIGNCNGASPRAIR